MRFEDRSASAVGMCPFFSWCFQPASGVFEEPEFMKNLRFTTTATNGIGANHKNHCTNGNGNATGLTSSCSLTMLEQSSHDHDDEELESPFCCGPVWMDDDQVDSCCLCCTEFDFFTRKHHCRACGLVFCANCAGHFEKVVKFGLRETVRLCRDCFAQATKENDFYEFHLPRLENGGLFVKHGMVRKKMVEIKYARHKRLLQYQAVDQDTRKLQGEIKAILLDSITQVRALTRSRPNEDYTKPPDQIPYGFVIFASPTHGGTEILHRFEAFENENDLKFCAQWIEALESALKVRDAMRAKATEHRAKQIEQENEEMKKYAMDMVRMEERKASFQEERLRKRKERREELRAKYNLPPTATTSTTTVAS